jgi:hypothetical protein
MLRRLRDVLQREYTDQSLNRQFRPNELRRDVVRAERLRRESHRVEPAPARPQLSAEEQRARRAEPSMALAVPAPQVPSHVSALKTRSGLRQAWLLKEILGPPLALRGPFGDDEP